MTKKELKKLKMKTTIPTFELAILGGGTLKDPQDMMKRVIKRQGEELLSSFP
jgi:hypothetical protein